VSHIFLSHSSSNNAQAVALFDWLTDNGWKDEVFLDLDPRRGIAPGEKWERALNEAADRCEAVLFLVSKAWIASEWCRKELNLSHRLNKRLFGLLIEDLQVEDLPADLTREWQLARLASGRDHVTLRAVVPITHEEVHVTFSAEGLQRLKRGLEKAGLNPKYFAWPPANDPKRPPYRGLRSLEAEDAGIFFGRDAAVIEALDRLRGMREAASPRLLVILGASGAGKSSFMRAGLLPRLTRDDRHFLPLPVTRPDRAALFGEYGLLRALEGAFGEAKIRKTRAELRDAIEGGALKLKPLLQSLAEKALPPSESLQETREKSSAETPPTKSRVVTKPKPPTLLLPIDQGEELFRAEHQQEARAFLKLLRDLITSDDPVLIALLTIRSDAYEQLQTSEELEQVRQEMINLPPMPKGSYGEVIQGPALRLQDSARPLKLEANLIAQLLTDIDEGGGKDALALLAFTLERLYLELGRDGELKLSDYTKLKGIKGSIEAAVERALEAADKDETIPKDRSKRLALLRRAFIPRLASIDPATGSSRRRVARQSEIPLEARPLIGKLVDQRLLATDVAKESGEETIEPVHEALLRQWGLLQGWLAEDAGLLGVLEGVRLAARDWATNGRGADWLIHRALRLNAVERLLRDRPDLAANLGEVERGYLAACRERERAARGRLQRVRAITGVSLVACLAIGLLGWWQQAYLWRLKYAVFNVRPYVLSVEAERGLKPGSTFKECTNCPEMIVVPQGSFTMGSPPEEKDRFDDESPQHLVTIAQQFAVSRFPTTFGQWDTCFGFDSCRAAADQGWGRGLHPVINVSWNEAQEYVAWLSKLTGKPYRLLTEAEYEYAARAGSQSAYFWGSDIGKAHAVCDGCGTEWDRKQTSPVGSVPANPFGLYDMLGNVWEMVQDCYQDNYSDTPTDGSAGTAGDCYRRVVRGGSWISDPKFLRSANRYKNAIDDRGNFNRGFRVARALGR
jgi:formylglycine-generating enzyme required for sulfatase activity